MHIDQVSGIIEAKPTRSNTGDGSSRTIQMIESLEQSAVLMDAARLELMRVLDGPASASELARRLGLPRQRVNYHLRELERVGLVREVEQRRKGNCVERRVVASSRAYAISPSVLGEVGGTGGQHGAAKAEVTVRFASEGDRLAFEEDLAAAIEQLAREYHVGESPEGEVCRVIGVCGRVCVSRDR